MTVTGAGRVACSLDESGIDTRRYVSSMDCATCFASCCVKGSSSAVCGGGMGIRSGQLRCVTVQRPEEKETSTYSSRVQDGGELGGLMQVLGER